MTIRKIASCLGVLSAGLAISSVVIAEDNCSGHTVSAGIANLTISDDHSLPSHLASGECHVTGPGRTECKFKDDDGDEWTDVSEWTAPGYEGTWRTVSGTGKYEKAVGALGRRKVVRRGPINVSAWTGYCPLAGKKQ